MAKYKVRFLLLEIIAYHLEALNYKFIETEN